MKTIIRKPIAIKVTKADITDAVPCNPGECPYARSLQRQGYTDASVGVGTVTWADEFGHWQCAELDADAKYRTWQFDLTGEMKPHTFTMYAENEADS